MTATVRTATEMAEPFVLGSTNLVPLSIESIEAGERQKRDGMLATAANHFGAKSQGQLRGGAVIAEGARTDVAATERSTTDIAAATIRAAKFDG